MSCRVIQEISGTVIPGMFVSVIQEISGRVIPGMSVRVIQEISGRVIQGMSGRVILLFINSQLIYSINFQRIYIIKSFPY